MLSPLRVSSFQKTPLYFMQIDPWFGTTLPEPKLGQLLQTSLTPIPSLQDRQDSLDHLSCFLLERGPSHSRERVTKVWASGPLSLYDCHGPRRT